MPALQSQHARRAPHTRARRELARSRKRVPIGRSTASAFITACLHEPSASEHEIARALRRAAPLARPNQRLIELADAALGRRGRMCRAIAETERGLSWDEVDAALSTSGEGKPFELASKF